MYFKNEELTLLEEVKSGLLTLGSLLIRKRRKVRGRGLINWGKRDASRDRCPEEAKKRVCKSSGWGECCRQREAYLVLKILEV